MDRTQKQLELRDVFFKNDCNGIFDIVPRFGKTRLAMLIIETYLKLYSKKEILIVTPSLAILAHWEIELVQYFGSLSDRINIINADSALNLPKFSVDLLIIDEIHLYTTDRRFTLINNTHIISSNILGLTGSMPTGYNYRLITNIVPVIDSISELEAIANKWISDFVEYNVSIDFPDSDKIEYVNRSEPITEGIKKFKNLHTKFKFKSGGYMFDNDVSLIYGCYYGKSTKLGYYKGGAIRDILSEKMGWRDNLDLSSKYNRNLNDNWSPMAIKESAVMFVNSIDHRQNLMNNNIAKLNAVLLIMRKLNNKKAIIFSSNIDVAEGIKDMLNNNIEGSNIVSYHSKLTKKPLLGEDGKLIKYKSGVKVGQVKLFGQKLILDDVIDGTIRGRYTGISVVNAFDQGVNIPNIDLLITTSGSTNVITHKQRTARTKTFYGDKVATIINLYFDDFNINVDSKDKIVYSRDKSKLKKRQGAIILKNAHSLSEFLSII